MKLNSIFEINQCEIDQISGGGGKQSIFESEANPGICEKIGVYLDNTLYDTAESIYTYAVSSPVVKFCAGVAVGAFTFSFMKKITGKVFSSHRKCD